MGNSSSAASDPGPVTLDSLRLGSPPSDWDSSKSSKFSNNISAPITEKIEPVGPQYLAHARRKLFNRTFSEDEEHHAKAANEAEAASVAAKLAIDAEKMLDTEIEPDHKDDLKRDAKEWKTQDHYRMLGLGRVRWRATPELIKKAHRTKVLVHHPDKKSGASKGNTKDDDGLFKCIQKAYEILSDPVKRRQYDSVDPIPEESYSALKEGAELPFIEAWRPVFEREVRFSVKSMNEVPDIGTMESTKEEVEGFYGFWYTFESWRSFEYLDKEEGDGPENRDDKRYMEKKNKAERAKLKKEDASRLRKLVDTAFTLDPRMAAFKELDKEAKEAKKRERQEQATKAKLEAEREAALAKEIQEEKESQERLQREAERKDKDVKKKAVRKEKKNIKTLIENANYGYSKGSTISPSALEIYLSELETMLDKLSIEELKKIVADLSSPKVSNQDKQKVLSKEAQKLVNNGLANPESLSQFDVDPTERVKPVSAAPESSAATSSTTTTSSNTPTKKWSVEEEALLIKAANKFPGGVSNRWETIAAYVALHTGLPQRDPEDVIKKSKAVQKGSAQEASVKQLQTHKKTFEIADAPSVRYDIEGEVPPVVSLVDTEANVTTEKKNPKVAQNEKRAKGAKASTSINVSTSQSQSQSTSNSSTSKATVATPTTPSQPKPVMTPALAAATSSTPTAALWTGAEQKMLEAGLKAYPPSWQGEGDRWDKIAEAVSGRTKKECKLRVKYLQEQVKAQRAAASGK
ncbi:hypothetical protein BGZ76_003065 [Entomortierella beljakovae]|nr:hypothetical protein BGZ76_003065 [Entomortierella beljakovae]